MRSHNTSRLHALAVEAEIRELRDGAPDPYFTERRGNGVRVYIGSRDVTLTPDHYTYTLAYRTDRQIGFFDDFDEGAALLTPMREGASDDDLLALIESCWMARDDRYSEIRAESSSSRVRVEMSYIGG